MIALGAYLVASVVAAAPAPAHAERLASTYDEAACDPSDSGECAEAPPADDPLSLPAAPAVLDCNDARLDLYIAEMIGSCDMPRPAPPNTAAPTVTPAAPTGPHRICDGLCAHDSNPMRPAPRTTDNSPPLAGTATPALAPPRASSLQTTDEIVRLTLFSSRLERPPRA
jgi:hypothetical protein